MYYLRRLIWYKQSESETIIKWEKGVLKKGFGYHELQRQLKKVARKKNNYNKDLLIELHSFFNSVLIIIKYFLYRTRLFEKFSNTRFNILCHIKHIT